MTNTTKSAALSILLLLPGAVWALQAPTFKIGDSVEIRINGIGAWDPEPCTVIKLPLPEALYGSYGVRCNNSNATVYVYALPKTIRAHAATAEDKGVEALPGAESALQAPKFNIGDYVEINPHGSGEWEPEPCKVIKVIPPAPLYGAYGVRCGDSDKTVYALPQTIRAHAATAEDKRAEAETAAALARQPRPGNTLGAMYGTREPKTCATRTAPSRGAPSADQARQYFICDSEKVYGTSLILVTNVKVQVAPISHPPNDLIKELAAADIDPREPVWDIRGSFTRYHCGKTGPQIVNPFVRTHNCIAWDQPATTGYCYKNTFADWHCAMVGALANERRDQLPPEGN
jgi:hypothetical protein